MLIKYRPDIRAYKKLDNALFYQYFKENIGERNTIETDTMLRVGDLAQNAVFFEIDSVWNSPYKRSRLLPAIKDRGLKIVTYIYDIIPILRPQFFHTNTLYKFMDYFGANIQYADAFIVSTQSVLDSIYKITDQLGLPRIPGYVSWLGSDFLTTPQDFKVDRNVEMFIKQKKKYVLIVGTIEPRKNHRVVLEAFDKELFDEDLCLVFVGRIGWNVEKLEKRIRNHPQLGKRFFFFEGLDDDNVNLLYKNAFFVAFPTYDEGFGLPMIEAFERGIPVIASDCQVLKEVGGDLAVYFQTESPASFSKTLRKYLDDSHQYEVLKNKIKTFVPFTWDQTTERIINALKYFEAKDGTALRNVKQVVILSARCKDLCDTLPFIERFMPFILELVLCCVDYMK